MMYKAFLLFAMVAAAFAASISSAAVVHIIEPYALNATNGTTILLGKVGPGQTFYITINSTTDNSTGFPVNYGWNVLNASLLPPGWFAQPQRTDSLSPTLEIRPSPSTPNGTYAFKVTAINTGNYSGLGSVTFIALVNVTPDVFSISVSPKVLHAVIGVPADVQINISNFGVSDNPFLINASGLPAWNRTLQVIALHGTSKTFQYPIVESTPGTYPVNITVSSVSSPLVKQSSHIQMDIPQSLGNDYEALGYGNLLFPIIYEPVYAVLYIIDLILR
ncbi:MAG: hypothetical protein M1564_00065 [Candidatus Marsarchaeota archaeon]|nr:hypothetical protein [Candidatus Marsarchaeota archaeon]MCL5430685.1 hypothetical protein [Candidatus Marsarchaeota archaeon]